MNAMAFSNNITSKDNSSIKMKQEHIHTSVCDGVSSYLYYVRPLQSNVRVIGDSLPYRKKKSYKVRKTTSTSLMSVPLATRLIPFPDESKMTAKSDNNNAAEDEERIIATSLKKKGKIDPFCTSLTTPKPCSQQLECDNQYWHSFNHKQFHTCNFPNVRQQHVPQSFAMQHRPSIQQPKQRKQVHFAPFVTVTVIRPMDNEYKLNSWYVRKDYLAFEMDCRESILAFHKLRRIYEGSLAESSQPNHYITNDDNTNAETLRNLYGDLYSVHGLDDFLSLEAKLLRSERRLVHAYNVLYNQMIFVRDQLASGKNEQTSDQSESKDDFTFLGEYDRRSLKLQEVAQRSSMESSRLALIRGSFPVC